MIKLLLDQGYKDNYAVFLPIADNLIHGNKKNFSRLENAYKIKSHIYKKLGKIPDANEVMIAYARDLIRLADDSLKETFNDLAIAENHYKKAIKVLQDYGQDTDEANKKLLNIQKQMVKALPVHEFKFDNSETAKMIEDRYSINYKECLKLLAVDTPWMEVEKIKQEVVTGIKEHPFQELFTTTCMNRNGNTTAIIPTIDIENPQKDQAALSANMYYKARQNEELYAMLALEQILSIIRSRKEFSEESLDFIVKENIVIPTGREGIFRTGLYLGLSGKYYEALHILAPQVENLFRCLAQACGDVVVVNSQEGIQQAITLGSIFDKENLNLCYDENILFTFRGLMEKKEGSNIRNLIGHGLMDSNEVGYAGIYFICAVYKLLYYNSKNVIKEYFT